MKHAIILLLLLAVVSTVKADEIILIYKPGNTLFSPQSGRKITSSSECADSEISRLLGKHGMKAGHRMGSDLVDVLDGYYVFHLPAGQGREAADSLSTLANVAIATVSGSIHPLSGATRTPGDYWYNHTYRWKPRHHHEGCDDPQYMPIPHYRQWFLPRGGYDRAWTVTTGDPDNVIAIIDSSFEIDHPDLAPQWAWNTSELNGTPDYDDDGNGYIDDVLGWDFGSYFELVGPDTTNILLGDPDIGHDQRWWEIMGCNKPWDCPCDPNFCICDGDTCNEHATKSAWGSNRVLKNSPTTS